MKNQDHQLERAAALRGQAEALTHENAAQTPEDLETWSPAVARQTLHELQVHQIELELQNEELRQTQVALDATRARYFDLYDLAPVGYCTLSAQGLILEANLTLATLLDVARGALVRRPLSQFIFNEDQGRYYYYRKQLFATGEPQACELRLVKKDGTVFWANLEATVVLDPSTSSEQAPDGAPVSRVVLSDITARVRTETALHQAQALNQKILATTPSLIYIFDLNAQQNGFANRSLASVLGYPPEQAASSGSVFLPTDVHPDDAPTLRAKLEWVATAQDGDIGSREYRVRHADGTWRWIGTREMVFSRAGNGTPKEILGMAQDITARKRTEEALRESEAKLKTLFDILPTGVSILDDERNIVDLNPALERILDISREGLLSGDYTHRRYLRHDGSPMPPEEFPSFRAWKEQAVVSDVETGIVKEDGTIVWTSVSAALLPVQGLSAAIVTTDITERKWAEETLRQNQRNLTRAQQIGHLGSWDWDVQGQSLSWSDELYRIFGGPHDFELTYEAIEARIYPDDRPKNTEHVQRLLSTGITQAQYEFRIIRPDGEMRRIEQTLEVTRDATGVVTRMFGIMQDITERVQAEQRVFELALERERMALLTKFINDVSHEFRTPLTIIQTNVYLLERLADPDKRQRKLTQIGEQVTGIVRLVELLVEMARLDSGVPFTTQPTDLNGLIGAVAGKLQAQIAAKGLTLHLALAPDLPSVPADDNRLGRALHELLGNAVRYTPAGGRITVRSSSDADGVTVEVQDTGPGIAPEALPHIFERFYRQDVAHSTPGFGLGLPITRAIVERHGGRLEVESDPGTGSVFRIKLPRADL